MGEKETSGFPVECTAIDFSHNSGCLADVQHNSQHLAKQLTAVQIGIQELEPSVVFIPTSQECRNELALLGHEIFCRDFWHLCPSQLEVMHSALYVGIFALPIPDGVQE